MSISHKDLVFQSAQYLRKRKRCNPVFIEQGTGFDGEVPDVIGWKIDEQNGVKSIVLECKVSLADFKNDSKKPHRTCGMGTERYYVIPEKIKDEVMKDLPDGWGLITCKPMLYGMAFGPVRFPKPRDATECDLSREVAFLRSRILEIQRFGRS